MRRTNGPTEIRADWNACGFACVNKPTMDAAIKQFFVRRGLRPDEGSFRQQQEQGFGRRKAGGK